MEDAAKPKGNADHARTTTVGVHGSGVSVGKGESNPCCCACCIIIAMR